MIVHRGVEQGTSEEAAAEEIKNKGGKALKKDSND